MEEFEITDGIFWENIFAVALILDLLDGLSLDAVTGLREELHGISYKLWELLPEYFVVDFRDKDK